MVFPGEKVIAMKYIQSALNRDRVAPMENSSSRSGVSNSLGGVIYTYESELRLIMEVSLAHGDEEVGGELFGLLTRGGRPVILRVTPPSPNARHGKTYFAQELSWLQRQVKIQWEKFGLQYIGRWHLHHFLNLPCPSGGDSSRIQSISGNNEVSGLIEIIVTFEGIPPDRVDKIDVHPFIYPDIGGRDYLKCYFHVLPGISPFSLIMNEKDKPVASEDNHSAALAIKKTASSKKKIIMRRRYAR